MIINGKLVAETIKEQLVTEVTTATNEGKRAPHLIIITVGDDPASKVYVRNKMRACEEIGIIVNHIKYDDTTSEDVIKEDIENFNNDNNTDGIMIQLPLPKNYNERELIDCIDSEKDVDGLTTINIGRLRSGQECIKPCTAQGIIDLLDYYDIDVEGKDVTIVGRSNIVGKPVADLLMQQGATITQCHSKTQYLEQHTKRADIVISAVGAPKFINHEFVCTGQVLIDVGINRDEFGRLCGDVDFDDVLHVKAITPVPGGVGPMTVIELIKNTVECWKKNT